jgi:hypothetical protein
VISFRSHVVSLLAVFLALAVGIALGGGPLSEIGRATTTAETDSATTDQAARDAAFADQVVAGSVRRVYASGLADRSVAVVVLPGAPESVVADVSEQVSAAGGSVAGTYEVQPALLAPGEKALVDTLGSQAMTQLRAAEVDAAAATYERIGQLLGIAVAAGADETSAVRRRIDQEADSIRQSLAGAELVQTMGTPAGRASYVVVLLGDDTDRADDPIYAGVIAGLAAQAQAVTVAASAADGADGRLARLREEAAVADVATVDGVDSTAGQVTAVLTLTEWPATRGHAYGASGADGAVGRR